MSKVIVIGIDGATPDLLEPWMNEGKCKIVLKVRSEKEIIKIKEEAKEKELKTVIICDRGLRKLQYKTATCLGIGTDH